MWRTTFIFLLGGLLQAGQPYNLLFVISDDIGLDHSWLNTNPSATVAPQPRLDTLADQGMLLTGCRSMPVCTPSRMALYTGRHQKRTGIYSNPGGTVITETEFTLADELNAHGYATGLFGKWGLGLGDGNDTPRTWGGFDHYSGITALAPPSYWSYTKIVNNVSTPVVDKYLTTDTADDAIEWINGQTDPWAAIVCFNAAHSIGLTTTFSIPPANLLSSTPPASAAGVEAYRATIEAMDTEIGRLMDSVALTNTIVVYISDNGGNYPQAPNVNGVKSSVFDDAHKVPLIIKGPGVAVGASSQVFSITDLYPTILQIVGGYAVTSPNIIDGRDISGVTRGEVVSLRPAFVAGTSTGPFCATDEDFRLIDYQDATPDLFFDLRTDPHELTTLTIGSLTGTALKHYNNLQYALTTYTAKTDEQSVVEVNYSAPSPVTGGIQVVSGGVTAFKPAIGSATITAPLKDGATVYTLWVRDNPFGSWVDSEIVADIGTVVTFVDPSPVGRKEYRITNDAPEP